MVGPVAQGSDKSKIVDDNVDNLIISHGEKQFHLITEEDLSFALDYFGAMASDFTCWYNGLWQVYTRIENA